MAALTTRYQRLLLGVCVIILVFAMARSMAWWGSPERRMGRFIRAVGNDQADVLRELADPVELQQLNIDPKRLPEILRRAAWAPDGIVLKDLTWQPLNEHQSRVNRWGDVAVCHRSGKVLLDGKGRPTRLTLVAYQNGNGWRIGISRFILGLLRARRGVEGNPYRDYHQLASEYAMRPAVFVPEDGSYADLSPESVAAVRAQLNASRGSRYGGER